MNSKSLDNMVKIGQLKQEPFSQEEYHGLVSSGKARLKDAKIISLSPESRFDLAYMDLNLMIEHVAPEVAPRFIGF